MRNILWPIYGKEHFLFLSLAIIIFFVIFNGYILFSLKDTLVVTSSSAETIVFLRSYMVFPATFIFFLIYTKLSNIWNQKILFYSIVIFFGLFFLIFGFFLYPLHQHFHDLSSISTFESYLPKFLWGLAPTFRYWTFSVFYVMAELWMICVLGILFWQFANALVPFEQAKRFYAHLQIFANIAVICAGQFTIYISNLNPHLSNKERWGGAIDIFCASLTIGCFFIIFFHYFICRNFTINNPVLVKEQLSKLQLPFKESIKLVFSSPYLLMIALLIAFYGFSINTVETTWRHFVKLKYPNAHDFNAFSGVLTTLIGTVTIIMTLIGGFLIRNFGWKKVFFLAPLIIGLSSLLFFSGIFLEDTIINWFSLEKSTYLGFLVFCALMQNIMTRGVKYGFFDPIKEMLYIPMNPEFKVKGKAAVDSLGNKIGKSVSGFFQQGLFIFVGPISCIMPYMAISILIVLILWCFIVRKLILYISDPIKHEEFK